MGQLDTTDLMSAAYAQIRAAPPPTADLMSQAYAQIRSAGAINAATGLDDGAPPPAASTLGISQRLKQSEAQDQAAQQAGFWGRTGAATQTAIGSGIDAATANTDRLIQAAQDPRRIDNPRNIPNTQGSQMMGVTDQTRAMSERAGVGSQAIAQAAALPTTLMDPTAIGPMLMSHGANAIVERELGPTLAAIEAKAGIQASKAVGGIVQGAAGVGAFSGLHAAVSYPRWDTDPAGGIQAVQDATQSGIGTGALFGVAGAGARGLMRPERAGVAPPVGGSPNGSVPRGGVSQGLDRQAAAIQSNPNGGNGNPEVGGDLSQTAPIPNHGLGDLNVPSQGVVQPGMVPQSHDAQVLNPVIQPVPVDMVNDLVGRKGAAKVPLHDEPLNPVLAPTDLRNGVPMNADVGAGHDPNVGTEDHNQITQTAIQQAEALDQHAERLTNSPEMTQTVDPTSVSTKPQEPADVPQAQTRQQGPPVRGQEPEAQRPPDADRQQGPGTQPNAPDASGDVAAGGAGTTPELPAADAGVLNEPPYIPKGVKPPEEPNAPEISSAGRVPEAQQPEGVRGVQGRNAEGEETPVQGQAQPSPQPRPETVQDAGAVAPRNAEEARTKIAADRAAPKLTRVYHYSTTEIPDFESRPGGTWFTTNESSYTRRGGSGVQNAVEIDTANLKLANNKQATEAGMYRGDMGAAVAKLKEQGFQGIKTKVDGDTHYNIFDPADLKKPEEKRTKAKGSEEVVKPALTPEPAPTVKPTGSLTRQQIEQDLVQRHQSIVGQGEQEQTHAHIGTFFNRNAPDDPSTLSASQRWALLPTEVRETMTPKEADKAGVTVTRIRGQAGGEDYVHEAHNADYTSYAAEMKGDQAPGIGAAKKFFSSGAQDPEAAFLSALHDTIQGKKKPPKMGTVDASTLKEGDTFTVGGKRVRVEKKGKENTAYLVLSDGADLPETPVDAMVKVPVDKEKPSEAARVSGTERRAGDGREQVVQPAGREAPQQRDVQATAGETPPPDRGAGKEVLGKEDGPDSIGLSKQDLTDIRERMDLGDAPEQQIRHVKDVLELAKLGKLDETAEENATRANAEGRPLSDEDTAGAAVRVANLDKQFRDLKKQAAEARAGKDTVTADHAEQQAEAIRQRMNSLVDAIDLSTSSAGRSLGIIAKLRLDRETVDLAHEIRVFEKAKEAKATPEERAKIESLTTILKAVQEDRDAALKREAKKDAAIAKMKAGQILTRNIARSEPGRKLSDARTKLALERNDIKTQLLSLTRRANDITGIAPEALYLLGKLAINHIRDGALTLAEVAKRVREDAKDAFPDMTDDDVNLALTTKDPNRQAAAKDATTKRVEALKREAALTQKLSEQAEKMKQEAPAKSAAADAAMREQQATLNEKSAADAARKQAIAEKKTQAQADALADRAAKEWKRQDEQRAKNEAKAQEAEARKQETAAQKASAKIAREQTAKQDRANRAQMRLVLDQLKANAKGTIDAGRRRDAIIAKIDALRQNLADQARPLKGKQAETPPDIADLKQQVEDLRKSMRTQDTLSDLQEQIRTGDFKLAARIEPKPVPKDVQLNQIKIAKTRQQINALVEAARPKSMGERISAGLSKWVRVGALSHPTVLAKLTGAAVIRTLSTPIEQGIGLGLSKAFPRLAEQAPREGLTSAKVGATAEGAAFVRMWTDGIRGSVAMLKNQHTELESMHGKFELPPELLDYFGRIHGALKNPVKEAEYARSLSLRTEHAIRNGVDVSDPIQQMRLSNEAYQDAQRAIFMQDNKVADAWKRGLRSLEEPNKQTGKPTGAQYIATAGRVLFPIVKVPLNVVHEASQVMTGMLTGPARAAWAYSRGIENLKPVEADAIMRQMKKGAIGSAILLLGFFNPTKVGGYYQQGEKRKYGEPQAGDIGPVPHLLLHNPYMEAAQFGATIRRVANSRYLKHQPDPNGVLSGTAAAAMGLLEEVPFVRESASFAKLLDPRQRENVLGQEVASKLVPGMVQWTAKQTDRNYSGEPTKRKPQGVGQAIEADIPGLRQRVPKAPPPK